jgi:hypothetical protein
LTGCVEELFHTRERTLPVPRAAIKTQKTKPAPGTPIPEADGRHVGGNSLQEDDSIPARGSA